MDRVALVFYLENVRDLEVVKYKIKQLWNGEKKKYKNDLYQHPTVAQEPELRESYVGDLIFYSIILAILIIHLYLIKFINPILWIIYTSIIINTKNMIIIFSAFFKLAQSGSAGCL